MYAVGRPCAVDSRASSGADHAQLDREADRQAAALDQREHALERLGRVLARDRVLHLGEAHEPRVRVDAMARVDVLGAAHQRASARLSAGIAPGTRRPGRQSRPSAAFSSSTSCMKAARSPGGSRLAVGALRGERERHARIGQHEGLEVVVRVDELVQAREHVVERRAARRPGGS